MSRHGYFGDGAFGQLCVVVPARDLVVVVTGAITLPGAMPDAVWDCLLPGLDDAGSTREDEALAGRLRRLSFAQVPGTADPSRAGAGTIDASAENSAPPAGAAVTVEPVDGGWQVRLGPASTVAVGHAEWRESSPLGRPVVATGAWQGDTFVADLYLITTPHRVRLVLDAETRTATATWSTLPLTGPKLELHLRSPLMTRPDVA